MPLRESLIVSKRVRDEIKKLMDDSRIWLEIPSGVELWRERDDLERFLREFLSLIRKAADMEPGRYTRFAYSVLAGVWEVFYELFNRLEIDIDELMADSIDYGDDEDEEE